MNIHLSIIKWLARAFDLNIRISEKLWRHGGIYFTELILLWIVTTSSDLNCPLFSIGAFKVDVMRLQTLGFVMGGFFFGWFLGENKVKERVNRIKNLKISLWLYIIGALLSGTITFLYNPIHIEDTESTIKWLFAISRVITCIGISGGIGINLTILALSTKNGEHSAPILLFTAFGVLGTVLCCALLVSCSWKYLPSLIFFAGSIAAIIQTWCLNRDVKKDSVKYKGKEYINQYEYKVNLNEFWSRTAPFVILGLPTFYLAGILASEADLLTDRWFGGKKPIENISALFLGIQYLGFAFICIIGSWKGRKYISEYRKRILFVGGIFQIIFVVAFFFFEGLSKWYSYPLILLSGAGIGINWGILMILIFEQEEFRKAQTYAATIIPNIIRFSLLLILLFPPLLKLGIDDDKNPNHKISQLGGLAVLVYLPFAFTLLVFKDKGERQARYALEDKNLREIVDEIINQQKTNNQNREINTEDPNQLLRDKFAYLKEQLREVLKGQTFDLINFYYQFDGESIEGTVFFKDEQNDRTEAIETILENTATKGLTNLLAISSQKRLSCVVIHNKEETQNDNVDLCISLSKREEEIIEYIKKELNILVLTQDEVRKLKNNIIWHKRIAKKSKQTDGKDYFIYVIRPIEDIAGVDTYLVLQRPTFITDKAIGSFQTLIDLTLLKHSKNLQQQLEAEAKELKNQVQATKNKNLTLENEINELKVKIDIKETTENKVDDWKKRVTKGYKYQRQVLEEIIEYANKLKIDSIVNSCEILLTRYNNQIEFNNVNVLRDDDFDRRLNQICSSLLHQLEELSRI